MGHYGVLGFPSEAFAGLKELAARFARLLCGKNGLRRRFLILVSVGFEERVALLGFCWVLGASISMGGNGKRFRKRTAPDSDSEQPEDDEEIRCVNLSF